MSTPNNDHIIIVASETASVQSLRSRLRLQAVETEVIDPQHLPERLYSGAHPPICLFFVVDELPLTLARDARAAWHNVQLVFVCSTDNLLPIRRALGVAPIIGADAVVFADDDAFLVTQIARSKAVILRRRKLRTTLDRANLQISASRPVEGVGLRRMAIAERYLTSFLEQADDAIIGLDAETRVLYWNRSATALFALSEDQVAGLSIQKLPFWQPVADRAIDALRGGASRIVEEFEFIGSGRRIMLEVVFSPVHEAGRQLVGLLLSARDITDRHELQQAERAVALAAAAQSEEERRRLATLFEAAPGFMAITSGPQHVFQMANRAYLNILGDRDLLARSVDNAFPDLTEQPFRRLRDQVYTSGEPFVGRSYPVILQRDAASAPVQRYLDFVYQPVFDAQGKVTGIFCQGSDVTEQKQMHERLLRHQDELERLVAERSGELHQTQLALQQSQKLEAVGKLTGGIAHDFNNILQVIGSNLELLSLQYPDRDGPQPRIRNAIEAVERGARLASDLLSFARRQPLKPVATSISRVVRDMEDLLSRALGEAVEVETVFGGGLWSALVDRNQLENVLLNLAINARDAMEGVGKLTIEVVNAMLDHDYMNSHAEVTAGQYVMLAVSDTGCGMSASVMAQAFEPFYTTKKEGQGTGLGLSMAYGFVKQSGGHIKIYSEPGNGTTVKIYLPRSFQAEAMQQPHRSGPIPGGNETVLVVEDDPDVQAAVVDQLAGLGYTVLRAGDAQAAFHILQSGIPVDLLFTDVVMPGPLRSVDLARMAREILPRIGVLFTSGYTQNAIVHGGRLDAGVELLSKPYRREDLARRVRHVLDRRPALLDAAKPSKLRVLVVEDDLDALGLLCEMLLIMGHDARGATSAEDAMGMFDEIDVLLTDIQLPGMSGAELARRALQSSSAPRVVFVSGGNLPEGLEFEARLLRKPYTMEQLQKLLDKQ